MKVIPGQEEKPNRLSHEDTCKLIAGIFNDPSTSFDDACIEKILIVYADDKVSNVIVTYSKTKVVTKEGIVLYFPIQYKLVQIELEEGLKLIARKI